MIRHRLFCLVFALVLPHMAHAWDDNCNALHPCIDAKGVEVSIKPVRPHGDYSFSPEKPSDDEIDSYGQCVMSGCKCEEKVDFPKIKILHSYKELIDYERAHGEYLIGKKLKEMAEPHRCDLSLTSAWYLPVKIYARPDLFSVVISDLEYCQGCGGSCHGSFETMTFKTLSKKAQPIETDEIVDKQNYAAIKEALLQNLKETNTGSTDSDDWDRINKQAGDYLDQNFWKEGFFIEAGKVKINIGDFLFSCANGDFNPVELPEKFIKPEFLVLLHAQKL